MDSPSVVRGRLMLTLGILLTLGGAALLYAQFSTNSPSVPSANFNSYSIGYSDGVRPWIVELDISPMTGGIYFILYFSGIATNSHFFLILPYEVNALNSAGYDLTFVNVPGSGSIIFGAAGSSVQGAATVAGMRSFSDTGTHSFVIPIGNPIPSPITDKLREIKELTNVPIRGFDNAKINLYLPKDAQILQTFPAAQNFQFFNGSLPSIVEQVITWQDMRNNITGEFSQVSTTYAIPSEAHFARLEEFGSGLLFGAGIPLVVNEVSKLRKSSSSSKGNRQPGWRRDRWSWIIAIAMVYVVALSIAFMLNLLDSRAAFTAAVVGLAADLAAPLIHLKLFEEPIQRQKRVDGIVSELNLFDNEWPRIRSRIHNRGFTLGSDQDLSTVKNIGDHAMQAQSTLREDDIKADGNVLVSIVRDMQELGTDISEVHRGGLIQTDKVISGLIERGDGIQKQVRDVRTKLVGPN